MSKTFKENLVGRQFDRWTVLEFIPNEKSGSYWRVKCSCSNQTEKTISRDVLMKGESRSCGCLKKELTAKRQTNDLTGKIFGRLTVLSQSHIKTDGYIQWMCKCECGKIKSIRGTALSSGHTKSCGCLAIEKATNDLIGKCFGRLTVLEKTEQRSDRGEVIWKCICSCAEKNICYINGVSLTKGDTKSCGCLRVESGIRNGKKNGSLTYKDLTGQIFGELTVLEKTNDRNHGEVMWKCKCSCENVHYVAGSLLKNGNTKSCGCISSYGNTKIKKILTENNISYIPEFKFKDLLSIKKRMLKFDFGIEIDNNIQYLIEFDGSQHFCYEANFNETYEEFLEGIERDKLKNKYCLDNEIPLIRIPFWELNNITLNILKLETVPSCFLVKNINHNEEIYKKYKEEL